MEACRKLGGCKTGDAKITDGYLLPARFIIHTVGPVWQGGARNEEQLLTSCYEKCLQIAGELHLHSIAFPNISTGVYGYPKELAAQVAIKETVAFLQQNSLPEEVMFVCFDEENLRLYEDLLKEQ